MAGYCVLMTGLLGEGGGHAGRMHRLRGNNSTETALLRVWSDILMAANERRLTLLCFSDGQ